MVLVVEVGTLEAGEHLTLVDGIAGPYRVADRAGRDGEQSWIDGRDHGTLSRYVANVVSFFHGRCTNPVGRDDVARGDPHMQEPRERDQSDYRRATGRGVPSDSPPAPLVDSSVAHRRILTRRASHRGHCRVVGIQTLELSDFHE